MTKIQILLSTMHRDNLDFINELNIKSDAIIINQVSSDINLLSISTPSNIKMYSFNEKGLSKSRNKALELSDSDICIISDDDVKYTNDYIEIIKNAYEDNPDADIIAFIVERVGSGKKKVFKNKKEWKSYVSSMQISSVEISFRREKIDKAQLKFNEKLGAGAEFIMGEENVFLFDALKAGLKILYLPIKIAEVDTSQSTWFSGYNIKFFQSLGAAYYNMSNKWCYLLIFQFIIRKYKFYNKEISMYNALKEALKGVKLYKSYER